MGTHIHEYCGNYPIGRGDTLVPKEFSMGSGSEWETLVSTTLADAITEVEASGRIVYSYTTLSSQKKVMYP